MLKNLILRMLSMTMALLMFAIPITTGVQAAPASVTFTVNSTLDQPDDLTIVNNTLSQNTALTVGGAIANNGTLKVSGSTIFGNSSNIGGGIYTGFGTLYVINSTLNSPGCVDETGSKLTTDQRGFPRPVGLRCDVGAFEYSPMRFVYLPFIRH